MGRRPVDNFHDRRTPSGGRRNGVSHLNKSLANGRTCGGGEIRNIGANGSRDHFIRGVDTVGTQKSRIAQKSMGLWFERATDEKNRQETDRRQTSKDKSAEKLATKKRRKRLP